MQGFYTPLTEPHLCFVTTARLVAVFRVRRSARLSLVHEPVSPFLQSTYKLAHGKGVRRKSKKEKKVFPTERVRASCAPISRPKFATIVAVIVSSMGRDCAGRQGSLPKKFPQETSRWLTGLPAYFLPFSSLRSWAGGLHSWGKQHFLSSPLR